MKPLPSIVAAVAVGAAVAHVMLNEPTQQAETGLGSAGSAWTWGSKAPLSGAGKNTAGRFKEGIGRVLRDDNQDQSVGAVKTGSV
jgi:hypothetical protein